MKLLKARPLVNNFFPLFDFFFHSTRCRRREMRTYSFPPSLSTTFFSFRKILFEPFASPSSRRTLCTCQTRVAAVRFPLPPGARCVYGLFRAKGQEVFSNFSQKSKTPPEGGVMSFPFDARRSGIRSRLRAYPGGAAPAFGSAARPTDSSRRWSAARAPCRTHSRKWAEPPGRPAPDRCSRRG